MGIDISNGYNAQLEKKKGTNQVRGEAIETLVSAIISTGSYIKTIKDSVNLLNFSRAQIGKTLFDEATHQFDMGNAAFAVTDLIKKQEEE